MKILQISVLKLRKQQQATCKPSLTTQMKRFQMQISKSSQSSKSRVCQFYGRPPVLAYLLINLTY